MADFCDFKKILSYRSVWMALAALWVVYHHISLTPPCAFLQFLKSCGAGGVDIFVFASGLGCYHSLKKNPDTLIFIKKRLIKIVPAYYLCVTPWVIFCFSQKTYHPHSAQLLCCVDSLVDLPASSFRYFGFFGVCELSVC